MKYLLWLLLCPIAIYAQVSSGNTELAKDVTLHWEIKVFKEKEHTIGTCKTEFATYICTIDGKPWYGSDADMDMPRNQLTKLALDIDGKTVALETTNMFNPNFSGKLGEGQFKLEKEWDGYRLYAFFSDGTAREPIWPSGKLCMEYLYVS